MRDLPIRSASADARAYANAVAWRLWSYNPFSAVGWAVAWLVTRGRIGRLPWYREGVDGWRREAHALTLEEIERRPPQGGTGMSGYYGPQESRPPEPSQRPRYVPTFGPKPG